MMEAGEDSDRHENFPALHEIKAIIIGSKAEYKCSAANTILGEEDCKVGEEIVKSEMKQNTVQNRSVTLVMTPGWWRSFTLAESAKYLKMEIVHSLKLCPDPHAFLLVINLHKPFTNMHLNSALEHMEILGEQIWNHTIVLLMYDDKEQRNADSKQLIERAGTELDALIQKYCATFSEMKAIIIGSKSDFKCTAANTILGHIDWKVGKETIKSEMKQRTNQNRSVTLVMTPGWWKTFTLAESAKYIQMEIVHSLKLCPDPHAFLLVINLHESFTDMHLNSVLEHMEILGEQIWNHTIVLLMYVNTEQRDADSKQLIERAGTELDALIQKCGNRVHVFNYTDRRGINVQKLFHEIERLVAVHEGQCFKIDSKLLEEMEEKRRAVKKQAEEREIQVKTKMQTLKQHLAEFFFPELRIVLMGSRIVGKTSLANTILKTTQKENRAKKCVMKEGEVDKRKVILIDTPGWWPYASVIETSQSVKQEILSSVSMCPPGPHAVLLVLQSGVAFSKAYLRSVKEHMELLGRNVWSHCIVVFTRGDWMGTPTIEEHIESEGDPLQWLINECGNRYHILNNMEQDDREQVRELMEKVEMMARRNTDLLTPVEAGMEESDSGCGSNWSEQDKLERGSLKLDPPDMGNDRKTMQWLENPDNVFNYRSSSEFSEDTSEDVTQS